MPQNPYTPPQAEVKDVESASLPFEKPTQVVRAVTLLWISLALGIIVFVLDLRFVQSTAPGLVGWIISIAVLGVMAFFIACISSGHNWARIVFLVLFLLGALPYFISLIDMFSRSVVTGSVSTVQVIVQAVAMYLVFTRPGSMWFRRRK